MASAAILLAAAATGSKAADVAQELATWRSQALQLLNKDRAAQDLPPLAAGPQLDEAAQAHAEDMFRRGYYAHVSPEGDDVQDRFLAAGGSRWKLVAENIARCEGCRPPITADTIRELETGWMNSPHHRENILHEGLDRFGYGIVLDVGKGLWAVQDFSGPGTPRGGEAGQEPKALPPAGIADAAASLLNRSRAQARVGAVRASSALSEAAARLLPPPGSEEVALDQSANLYSLLPEGERNRWRSPAVVVGACGGCGKTPTDADLRSFRKQWLDDPGYAKRLLDPAATDLGLALQANGEGRKVAVLVLGTAR